MKFSCLPLLALTLLSAGALAVNNPYQLTTEAELPALYEETLPDRKSVV